MVAMSLTDVRTYTVQVFRQDGHWILEIPELRAVGQSRTLAGAGPTARELAALWVDVPIDQVHVALDYSRIDPEAVELAAGARCEQAKAEELSRGAAKRLRQAARRLVQTDGLSLRDAATVLGVTFGRVQQLLKN
jgi:DNA-directed RNA polymerase specialized sigma24 family protein